MPRARTFVGLGLLGAGIALGIAAWLLHESDPRGWSGSREADGRHVLVRIDGEAYARADLEHLLERPARFGSRRVAQAALEHLVEEVVVARARGLDLGAREAAGSRAAWLEDYARGQDLRRPVTETDVERYYAEHLDDYVRPMQVRLLVLALPERVGARHSNSLYLQAQMSASPAGFSGYVRELDRHFRARDAGLVDCDGSARSGLPAGVVRAACDTRRGELLPPIATDQGWFLVRNAGVRTGRDVPLAEVRGQIRRLLEERERRAARERAVADLRQKAEVVVHEDAAAALVEPSEAGPPPVWPPPPAEAGPPSVPGELR